MAAKESLPTIQYFPPWLGQVFKLDGFFISGVATNHFSYCRYSMINTDCVWFICRINTTLSVVSKRGYSNLIGGLEHVLFFHRLGISSPQLTFTFFRGVGIPPWDDMGCLIICPVISRNNRWRRRNNTRYSYCHCIISLTTRWRPLVMFVGIYIYT